MLLEALARDDHPLYNVEWAMRLWRSCQCAVVLQKLWGLTHPERPFAASANVIVLEGQDAEQVVEICGGLGHDLTRSLQCTIPFTFPPYLCDADWELQHAHCLLARREPIGRKPNVGGGGTPEGATTFAAMRGRSSITLGICGAGLETAQGETAASGESAPSSVDVVAESQSLTLGAASQEDEELGIDINIRQDIDAGHRPAVGNLR